MTTLIAYIFRSVPSAYTLIQRCEAECLKTQVRVLLPPEPIIDRTPAALEARAQRFRDLKIDNWHALQIAQVVANKVAQWHGENPAWRIHSFYQYPASSFEENFPSSLASELQTGNPIELLSSPSFIERVTRAYSAHYALQVIAKHESDLQFHKNSSSAKIPHNGSNPLTPQNNPSANIPLPQRAHALALSWLKQLRSPVIDYPPVDVYSWSNPEIHSAILLHLREQNRQLGSQAVNIQNKNLRTYAHIHRDVRNIFQGWVKAASASLRPRVKGKPLT